MKRDDAPASERQPSRAALRREIDRKAREFTQPAAALPDELEVLLDRPRLTVVPPQSWDLIGDTVTEVMRRSQFRGREVFAKRLRVVAMFVWWAFHAGYAMELPVLLAEPTIEDWFRRGLPDLAPETRATYRSHMRNIARAVNPHNSAPTTLGRSPHKDLRPPYQPKEIRQFLWLAGRVRDRRLRALTATVIALGAGAGLDARDLAELRLRHITDLGEQGILVSVPGGRARTVWVLRAFEAVLREELAALPKEGLVLAGPARMSVAKNFLPSLYARLRTMDPDLPRVEQSRLRATWLTTLMCVPVPLAVLLNAAGLESARSLVDLLPHAQAIPAEQVADFLRGAKP